MRPRVICIESHARSGLTRRGKKQAVITLRPSVIGVGYKRHQLPIRRTLEAEAPALIRIGGCRAAGNVHRRIVLPLSPQMRRLGSDVGPREKPIRSTFFFESVV